MMLVLGVDPGSNGTGYGLVEGRDRHLAYIDSGVIHLPQRLSFHQRIHRIFQSLVDIMGDHRPVEMALEDLFYAKNAKSALKLGHARGAVVVASVQCHVPIFEYTPLEIKKSTVGYGRASKEQVRSMVCRILGIDRELPLDASDALATAICHLNCSLFAATRKAVRGNP